MDTTRLSLIKEGEIVLLLDNGKEEAFHVIEHNNGHNKLTKGVLITKGDIVLLGGGISTHPLTNGWINKQISKVEEDITEKTLLLQRLKTVRHEKND